MRTVQLLLQNGADVHAKDKGGLVPLHNACSYGHFEVTELLLKAGASVNAMDLWQFTPLHEAASKNRVEVCSLLLAHGADPYLMNCHSKSALDVAPLAELQDRLKGQRITISTITKASYRVMIKASIVLYPLPSGLAILFLLFPASAVQRMASHMVILRKSIRAIFTKFGVQDNWVSVLFGIAFSCCSSFTY